jgi:hypothetical protein
MRVFTSSELVADDALVAVIDASTAQDAIRLLYMKRRVKR